MNGDGRSAQGNNFLMQVLYLPVTLFMSSIDMLGKMLGGAQRAAATATGRGQSGGGFGAGTVPGMPAVSSGPVTNVGSQAGAGLTGNTNGNQTNKENYMSIDQDLSGDEIKTVVYSIFFTKRDLEAPLKGLTEDVVNYATNAASYGGLMISKFSGKDSFKRPQRWKDASYPSPDAPDELRVSDLPDEDQRYITIDFKVVNRFAKGDADYQKRQTIALEGIERNTKALG
jgi:hypothetical protein